MSFVIYFVILLCLLEIGLLGKLVMRGKMEQVRLNYTKREATTPPTYAQIALQIVEESDEEVENDDRCLLTGAVKETVNDTNGVYDFIFSHVFGLVFNQEVLETVCDRKLVLTKRLKFYVELLYETKLAVEQENRTERQKYLRDKFIKGRNYAIFFSACFVFLIFFYYFKNSNR
jgi:hypothetical protein